MERRGADEEGSGMTLADVLRAMGGGVAKVPSYLRDLLTDEVAQPEFRQRPIFAPESFDPDQAPNIREMETGPLEPAFGQSKRKVRPGVSRFLQENLPRMLEAGIAGAATENVAGGGPTDILRAMQAGRGAVVQKDLLTHNMRRQQMLDEQQGRVNEANI